VGAVVLEDLGRRGVLAAGRESGGQVVVRDLDGR
jgi:hypothetical protein